MRIEEFLENFNSSQQKAIMSEPVHMAINAGAGTGKTATLAARIIYLQKKYDIRPSNIIALSFSRMASINLRERLDEYCLKIGSVSPVHIYTFHGLAWRIIRLAIDQGESTLRSGFDVFDSSELFSRHQQELLQGVTLDLPAENLSFVFCQAIDILRQGSSIFDEPLKHPDYLIPSTIVPVPGEFGRIIPVPANQIRIVWERYLSLMQRKNCLDYSELLLRAIDILNQQESLTANEIRRSLRCIMVDEYQDTSRIMESLLFSLAGENAFINVVGDVNQAIYTFNGSSPDNLQYFCRRIPKNGFPVGKDVFLIENYRSTKPIITAASQIQSKLNTTHVALLQPAEDGLKKEIQVYCNENLPVYRVLAPDPVLGADYIAREVKRLLDQENLDPCSIAILVRKDTEFSPQGDLIRTYLDSYGISSAASDSAVADLANLKIHYYKAIDICNELSNLKPREILAQLEDGQIDDLLGDSNRDEISRIIREAPESQNMHIWDLVDYLEDKLFELENHELRGQVQVRTIHSAKGMEFRVVFLFYLGDRQFPHGRNHDSSVLEEEKRLLYVGVTRAQERLYLVGQPGIHEESFYNYFDQSEVEQKEATVIGKDYQRPKERLPILMTERINRAEKIQEVYDQKQKDLIECLASGELSAVHELTMQQQKCITACPEGHFLIRGVAGSGKTTVLLARAFYCIDRYPGAKIVFLTFNGTLSTYLKEVSNRQGVADLKVNTFHSWGREILSSVGLLRKIISDDEKKRHLTKAIKGQAPELRNNGAFKNRVSNLISTLKNESIYTYDEFLDIYHRELFDEIVEGIPPSTIWQIYQAYNISLKRQGLLDLDDIARVIVENSDFLRMETEGYDFIFVDEAQDLTPLQLNAVKCMARKGLVLAIDGGQRIYEEKIQIQKAGIFVNCGRTRCLLNTYRSTQQIVRMARAIYERDKLAFDDSDFIAPFDPPFQGSVPEYLISSTAIAEKEIIVQRCRELTGSFPMHTIGLFVGKKRDAEIITDYLHNTGLPVINLKGEGMDKGTSILIPGIKVCTYHSAKGLEFDHVIASGINEGKYPFGSANHSVDGDINNSWIRRFLYTAFTRAKLSLTMTSYEEPFYMIRELDDNLYKLIYR